MTQWGIDTLFNPGKRHMDEEKRRLQSTREEIGDSSGGRRIDLESGTVTIPRRGKGEPPADPAPESGAPALDEAELDEAEGNAEPAEAVTESDEAEADEAGPEPTTAAPTGAQAAGIDLRH